MTKAATETKEAEVVTKPARMPVRQTKADLQPYALIRTAVEQGADVETLKELVALQHGVAREEARKAWHVAMVKFAQACPEIPRTKKGRFGWYAPLGSTMALVRPLLAKHGLSATWTTTLAAPYPYKVCKLAHELGHVEEAACPIIVDDDAGKRSEDGADTLNAMQKYGIADTYAERYSFEAVAGLVSAEAGDGDGNAPRKPVQQPRATQPKATAPIKSTPVKTEEPTPPGETTQEPPDEDFSANKGLSIVQAASTTELTGFKKNKEPWRKVILKASDDIEYSTFSKSFGIILEAACPTQDHPGEYLQIEWIKGRYGREVKNVDVTQGPPE